MVNNIREVDETLTLFTNGESLSTNMKADLPGWGELWFSPKGVTNIFSMAEMVDRHDVEYSSRKEDAFRVYLPNKVVKFARNGKLYNYTPSNFNKPQLQFINTTEENKKFHSNRQVSQAKRARELFSCSWSPIGVRHEGNSSNELNCK